MRRLSLILVPAASALLLLGSGTVSAQAAPGPAKVPAAQERCNKLHNGRLCLKVEGSTVSVSYRKTAGSHIKARFKYTFRGVDHWGGGWFKQYPNETKSYTWKHQRLGCGEVVGHFVVEGERTFSTPPINPCR